MGVIAQSFEPDDPVPPFQVKTLNGWFSFSANSPLILYAFNSFDAYSVFAWQFDNSVQWFLQVTTRILPKYQDSPNNTEYLFLSYSETDTVDQVKYMRQRLLDGMVSLNYSSPRINQVLARMHFGVNPVSSLTSTWIPALLSDWPTEAKGINVSASGTEYVPLYPYLTSRRTWMTRLDALYDWLPFPQDGTSGQLIFGGNGCGPVPKVNQSIVLLAMNPAASCSYATMINNAQQAGAMSVIIYPCTLPRMGRK